MSRFQRFIPRTLFGRSLLIFVTPLVLLQLVAGYVFFAHHWETVSRRLAGALAGEIGSMIDLRRELANPDDFVLVLAQFRMRLIIDTRFEPDIRLRNSTDFPAPGIFERTLYRALAEQLRRPFRVDSVSDPKNITISVELADGVMHFTTQRKRLFTRTTYLVVAWMVGTSILLLAVAVFFLRKQIRPIRRLAKAAEGFGKGRDFPNFKPEGASEVRQAAAAFIEMRERIRRQISQRTDMLAGVSHDLRTPLTRVKLQLAMLGESEEIGNLKSDVAEMEKMIDGYLAFARGEGDEAPAPTELGALLAEVVASGRRKGGTIAFESDGEMTLAVRRSALKRCFTNLVENALRHGEHVVVAVARHNDTVEVAIEDDGPGIPDDKRDEVFRAFYRLDASRNPETGGVGLGLTIARDVVRGHGGDIVLAGSSMGGLRALVRLPV
ncbi:MAG: ATP-binding protein [Alphaproteobacteria bacterium]